MMRRNFLRGLTVLLSVHWGALATAATPINAENTTLRPAVNQFMRSYANKLAKQLGPETRVEYTVSVLEAGAGDAICATPLKLNPKDAGQLSSRLNVQVSCGDAWSVYVPVDLAVFRPVVVAIKPIGPGSTIDSDDVQLAETDITQLFGQYLTDLDEAVNMSVKRSIPQGAAVISQQLVPPLMIRRGDVVVINAATSVIAVKMSGTALTDGRRGEQIRIKNQGSARVIEARVTGPGQVQTAM
ncbi:MAG: flagella basal body P-ring formation protein FlgA [Verrucomicrobiaceae bacterium]|nr:flagella basal body P-ring formation protein FlgA [Verrucomicrobiaceae bacterium]